MNNTTVGLLFTCLLLVLVCGGMRVAFAAALVGLLGLITIIGMRSGVEKGFLVGIAMAGTIPHSKSVSYALSILPMFILIGFLAFYAGITDKIFDAARKWVGWLPGGLAVATVFATAGFAAVSGASTATAAVFARVAIPEMLKSGYDRRLAAGVVAAGGTLASLIPPSGLLVIYAIIVEESVAQLLVAGFLPGMVSALIYGGVIVLRAKINPGMGPPVTGFTWSERVRSLPGIVPVLLVIVIIFGGMYFGLATPTEAGALGAFVVLVLAALRGTKLTKFKEALLETSKLTVMIFTIIWGVLLYVRFLGFAGIPEAFTSWIVNLDLPAMAILIAVLLCYMVLGMFMDAIGMLLLTLPIVQPAMLALGFDPIWFGIIVIKMAEICLITPPIGLNCYVVSAVRPDIPVQDVFRGTWPFFVADVVTVAVLVAFPSIVLVLPQTMMQ